MAARDRTGPAGRLVERQRASAVTPAEFVDGNSDERIGVGGTWRQAAAARCTSRRRTSSSTRCRRAFDAPDALRRRPGSRRDDPRNTRAIRSVTGTVSVGNGRVERVSYQKLGRPLRPTPAGVSTIDLRLDQSPGVWITAVGKLPLALFNASFRTSRSTSRSSRAPISLGLDRGRHRASCANVTASCSSTSRRSAPAAIRISTARSRSRNAGFLRRARAAPGTRTCAPR